MSEDGGFTDSVLSRFARAVSIYQYSIQVERNGVGYGDINF